MVRTAAGAGVRCMLMRGGTSKGAYFLASDLPADPAERDDLLVRVMGRAAGAELAVIPAGARYDVEHPTGHLEAEAEVEAAGGRPRVRRSGVVRTARKLFDGFVFPREDAEDAGGREGRSTGGADGTAA